MPRAKSGQPRTYTEEDREIAVVAWVDRGSYRKAEEATGIPYPTIAGWHKQYPEWWERKAEEHRQLKEPEQQALLMEMRTSAAREVLERLEHGDMRLTAKGELKRVPVTAKDAATIYGICTDKYRVSLGQPTSIQGKAEQTTGDKLTALKQMARDKAIESGDVAELRREGHDGNTSSHDKEDRKAS